MTMLSCYSYHVNNCGYVDCVGIRNTNSIVFHILLFCEYWI